VVNESTGLVDFSRGEPMLLRRESEFSVTSAFDGDVSGNDLSVWQAALLLTADNVGTGILALPGNVRVLGWALGLGFLIGNFPINQYAGTILSKSANGVEERRKIEDHLFQQSMTLSDHVLDQDLEVDETSSMNGNVNPLVKMDTNVLGHTQLHHDTATFDFIGMTQALFQDKRLTHLVMGVSGCSVFVRVEIEIEWGKLSSFSFRLTLYV